MNINLFWAKFKREWHFFRMRYHELLLAGCLDYELKIKLQRKISYHRLNGACHAPKFVEDCFSIKK